MKQEKTKILINQRRMNVANGKLPSIKLILRVLDCEWVGETVCISDNRTQITFSSVSVIII